MIINPGSSRLHAATVGIDDPGTLNRFIGPDDQAFVHGQDGFVAIGEIARFETSSIAEADQWWRDQMANIENSTEMPGHYGTGPLVTGSFVFDPQASAQKSVLIIPQTVIGRRGGRAWLTQTGYDRVTPRLPEQQPPAQAPRGLRFTTGSLTDVEWKRRVAGVIAQIMADRAGKVVMARDLLACADAPIDLRWAFNWLSDAYGSCWTYLIDGLVGSTPEMIIRRQEGMTMSRVLAGTIQRVEGINDYQQSARLQASMKDVAEHRMAAESVTEALVGHLRGMHSGEAPFVLTLPNVMHLATDICGISDPEQSTLFLADRVHPTAAVCGTPREVARQIIADQEGMDRGRFAGIVGWMDAQGDGEWGLALRCGQVDPADPCRMRLFAGAGIVAGSDPHAELVETEAKMTPMKQALRGA